MCCPKALWLLSMPIAKGGEKQFYQLSILFAQLFGGEKVEIYFSKEKEKGIFYLLKGTMQHKKGDRSMVF